MSRPRAGNLISPSGYVVLATLLSVAYLAADAAGWRECTSILSGTPSGPPGFDDGSVWRGLAYVALYLGFVLLVPVLLIAAPVFALLLRRISRTSHASLSNGNTPQDLSEDRRCAQPPA